MRSRRELDQRLGEQIAWLRASAISFDAGTTSESKRIAVAVRTLVHDTAASQSLLSQLKMRDRITWLSAVPLLEDTFVGPPWVEGPNEPGYRHIPGMPQFECTFSQWWRGRMLEFNRASIDRSWFVLRTANFDGGAHVDPVLPADYESITRKGGLRPLRINSAGNPYPDSTDPVPSALRTICTEVVMSIEQSW
ncbi:hypothetical protein [Microbacterium sp. T2.11-28]|uniref:hypothetical protein n=1 Tax=Microbacterium sp. T2.11-28 TaxID=3041169 RepID=UPI00253F8DE0|nr:hypothetical protein [Microbacterium sp. T2.11-28]